MSDLPDDATEVVDADLPRADLVKAPASGMPFFIAKAQASTEDESDRVTDLCRTLVTKAVLTGLEDLFPGYLAPVEHPVVVGAEHDDVLKSVCSTIFPGHYVADIAGRLVPPAYRADVKKLVTDCLAEGAVAPVRVEKSTAQLLGMADALTTARAVAGLRPNGAVIRELLATDRAGHRHSTRAIENRLSALMVEAARPTAELRKGVTLGTTRSYDATTMEAGTSRHCVSLRSEIAKAAESTRALNDLPDSAFAYVESGGKKDDTGKTVPRSKRHFPIYDAAHVRNALARAPQSPFGDKAMPAIRAAAKKFGVDVSDDVSKSDAEDVLADAVATPKLGDERPSDAPGDPDDPASAAWEAVDAAGGRAAVNALVSLKDIVADLLSREAAEDFAGTDDDACENTCDLDSVLCALDFALGVLAPFAVTEQAEADERAEDALVKATATVVQIVKAGRVLSSANEAAIRGAVESLQKVLDSLPAAKEADVTKADETVADDVTKAEDTPATPERADVAKANADDLSGLSVTDLKRLAITGADGQRTAALAELGLRSISGDLADDADDAADDAENDTDPTDATDATADEADDDMPDDTVTKSTEGTETEPDPIQKAIAETKAEFDSLVKALQERINALEESPAPSKVLTNGAVPPAEHLRGQDTRTPVAKATEEVVKRLDADQRQEVLYGALRHRYTA